jgi:hypothetical protein
MYKPIGVTKPCQKGRRTRTRTTPPSGARPGRVRRAGLPQLRVLAAALAGVALLAAACGGGTGPVTAPPASHDVTNSTDNAQGVAYTRCMRAHGVPKFPDPNSQGELFNGAYLKQAGVVPDSPQVQAAGSACSHLLPAGAAAPGQHAPRTCSNGVCRAGQPPTKPK